VDCPSKSGHRNCWTKIAAKPTIAEAHMKPVKPAKYTYEFRQNAIKLATTTGRSVQAVALELNIPSWRLRNWIKEHKEKLDRSSDIDEQIRMQRRIKELEEENLILKKAAAYFAKASL
jgi:transposase-like protein